jgi:hypothetical protein
MGPDDGLRRSLEMTFFKLVIVGSLLRGSLVIDGLAT